MHDFTLLLTAAEAGESTSKPLEMNKDYAAINCVTERTDEAQDLKTDAIKWVCN